MLGIHAQSAHFSHGNITGRGRGCAAVDIFRQGAESPVRLIVVQPFLPSPLEKHFTPDTDDGWRLAPITIIASEITRMLAKKPDIVSPSWSGAYRALRDLLHHAGGDGWLIARSGCQVLDLGKLRTYGDMTGTPVPEAQTAQEAVNVCITLQETESAWFDAVKEIARVENGYAKLTEAKPLLAICESDISIIMPLPGALPNAPHLHPCLSFGTSTMGMDACKTWLAGKTEHLQDHLATFDIGDLPLLIPLHESTDETDSLLDHTLPKGLLAAWLDLPLDIAEQIAEARNMAIDRNNNAVTSVRDARYAKHSAEDAKNRARWLAQIDHHNKLTEARQAAIENQNLLGAVACAHGSLALDIAKDEEIHICEQLVQTLEGIDSEAIAEAKTDLTSVIDAVPIQRDKPAVGKSSQPVAP